MVSPDQKPRILSHNEMRSLAALCGGVALLLFVALSLSGGDPSKSALAVAGLEPSSQGAGCFAGFCWSDNGDLYTPPIYSFTASRPNYGSPALLSWTTGFVTGPGQAGSCLMLTGGLGSFVLGLLTLSPGATIVSSPDGTYATPPVYGASQEYTLYCTEQYQTGQKSNYASVTAYSNPPPYGGIRATPPTVRVGQSSTIAWYAQYSDYCTMSGPGAAASAAGSNCSGWHSTQTSAFSSPGTYTYGVTYYTAGTGWVTGPTATVTVTEPNEPPPTTEEAPVVVLAANGQSSLTITGGTYTLSWDSANAASCTMSYAGSGSGSYSVTPNRPDSSQSSHLGSHTLTCVGINGQSATRTVTVARALPTECTGADCRLNCTPATVLPGGQTTCTWMCSPALYTSSAGGGFSTGGTLSGSRTVNPTQNTSYSVTCRAAAGPQTTATAAVRVNQPQLTLTATPDRVQKGGSSTVSWSATSVTGGSCRVTSNTSSTVWAGNSGSQSALIALPTTFTLTCAIPSGNVQKTVTVNLIPTFEEI